jgi:hypothetical protein
MPTASTGERRWLPASILSTMMKNIETQAGIVRLAEDYVFADRAEPRANGEVRDGDRQRQSTAPIEGGARRFPSHLAIHRVE